MSFFFCWSLLEDLQFMFLVSVIWSVWLLLLALQSLEVSVWRDGKEFHQKYSRGKPVSILTCHVPSSSELKDHQGTRIRFWPDKEGLTWPSWSEIFKFLLCLFLFFFWLTFNNVDVIFNYLPSLKTFLIGLSFYFN